MEADPKQGLNSRSSHCQALYQPELWGVQATSPTVMEFPGYFVRYDPYSGDKLTRPLFRDPYRIVLQKYLG
jgi:hypothetical protein